ncbi:TIGR00304 family membrane protein [Methanolobus psychrotolerans]|uniref:TIGR00304 family membrane protein n=1 Tax=Methanolobus psychrotolerans TaxID=1874706 RepID=UPI000B91926B|nr:DUF131 domain-containing protein [Methanolobus psychrotolerans]
MFGSYLVIMGVLMIVSGFLLIFAKNVYRAGNSNQIDEYTLNSFSNDSRASSRHANHEAFLNKTEVQGGGIITLGPISIILGSDHKSTQVLIIQAVVLMVLYFLIFV